MYKKSDDIITQRVVKAKLSEPVKMQEYVDERDIQWIGRTYHVAIHRQPADSLAKVKDETGQQFVDNIITHELGWGKINGWQKGIYYKHNFPFRQITNRSIFE